MPVKPEFTWEQTAQEVLLHVTIKGFKPEAIDVFISDVFVKVNAPPTYLLNLDLLHPIDPDKSTHHMDSADPTLLQIKLHKVDAEQVWDALCVNHVAIGKAALRERRARALAAAEQRYNTRLQSRAQQREVEKRRLLEEQWQVERRQRSVIESRVADEKAQAETELYAWADRQSGVTAKDAPQPGGIGESVGHATAAPPPRTPADIQTPQAAPAAAATQAALPQVREAETVHVTIDFTPRTLTMPSRARGDEEYYRKSRYKPVSIEDSPMFWKARADGLYRVRDWKGAAEAYSESIKRDGVFLTCVMNRAAAQLHRAEFKRAIDDCTLALTLLANTPASELTQERYRYLMTKLHARRAAAHCWNHDLRSGLADLRMARAYVDADADAAAAAQLTADLQRVETAMQERGLSHASDEAAAAQDDGCAADLQRAAGLYYQGKYEEAVGLYEAVLQRSPYAVHARANLSAALLHLGRFSDALEHCTRLIEFCAEVAAALNQPGGADEAQPDSDDEDETSATRDDDDAEGEAAQKADNLDETTMQRRAASKLLSERSGHVYLLLKAYVRGAAALCGLQDYRKAHTFLEHAVRITPYDNDLLDDCNRLAEKIRMQTLVSASTQSAHRGTPNAQATAAAA